VLRTWTLEAVIVPPAPVGELARHGAAALVDEVATDSAALEGSWFRKIAEECRAGTEVHGLLAREETVQAVTDRWAVLLRTLIEDTRISPAGRSR
jgi:hypothetical protein